jgi:hypothetical protein
MVSPAARGVASNGDEHGFRSFRCHDALTRPESRSIDKRMTVRDCDIRVTGWFCRAALSSRSSCSASRSSGHVRRIARRCAPIRSETTRSPRPRTSIIIPGTKSRIRPAIRTILRRRLWLRASRATTAVPPRRRRWSGPRSRFPQNSSPRYSSTWPALDEASRGWLMAHCVVLQTHPLLRAFPRSASDVFPAARVRAASPCVLVRPVVCGRGAAGEGL